MLMNSSLAVSALSSVLLKGMFSALTKKIKPSPLQYLSVFTDGAITVNSRRAVLALKFGFLNCCYVSMLWCFMVRRSSVILVRMSSALHCRILMLSLEQKFEGGSVTCDGSFPGLFLSLLGLSSHLEQDQVPAAMMRLSSSWRLLSADFAALATEERIVDTDDCRLAHATFMKGVLLVRLLGGLAEGVLMSRPAMVLVEGAWAAGRQVEHLQALLVVYREIFLHFLLVAKGITGALQIIGSRSDGLVAGVAERPWVRFEVPSSKKMARMLDLRPRDGKTRLIDRDRSS